MPRRPPLRAAAAALAGLAVAVPAVAAVAQQMPQPTDGAQSTTVFKDVLTKDEGVTATIKGLLSSGRGTIDRAPQFGDLTGDGKADAVVRVLTAGSAGAVAVYVLSTDGSTDGDLRVVYRNQSLHRVVARVSSGALLLTVPAWKRGDDVCCPSAYVERGYLWNARTRAFRRTSKRDVPSAPGAPAPAAPPAATTA
jgi:hypothetical protein